MNLTQLIQQMDIMLRNTDPTLLKAKEFSEDMVKTASQINTIFAKQLSSKYKTTVTNTSTDHKISYHKPDTVIHCNFRVTLPFFHALYIISVQFASEPMIKCSVSVYTGSGESISHIADIDDYYVPDLYFNNAVNKINQEILSVIESNYRSDCWTAKELVDLLERHGKVVNGDHSRITAHKMGHRHLKKLINSIIGAKHFMKLLKHTIPPISKPYNWEFSGMYKISSTLLNRDLQ